MNAVKEIETSAIMKILKEHLGIGEYSVIIAVWQQEIGNNKVELADTKAALFSPARRRHINDLNLRKTNNKKINQYQGKNLIKT